MNWNRRHSAHRAVLLASATALAMGCSTQSSAPLAGPGPDLDSSRDAGLTDGDGASGPDMMTDGATPKCNVPPPGRAPLRRLTRFEYNHTVADLLGDDTSPADSLPAELLGNGFGNDADQQPVSSFLIEQYASVAQRVAERAVMTGGALDRYAPCHRTSTPATAEACARTFIDAFVRKAYRRPPDPSEVDDLAALARSIRTTSTLETSLGSVIEAVLQTPDFLYRPELGVPDPNKSTLLRPSGHEMATRLSYLFWGTAPDETLYAAAASGELLTDEGVLAQATRMLADPRAREVIAYFFDSYLPLNTLTDLARDPAQYPTFSPTIGALMRKETQRFLAYEIFEGSGTWPGALTAPYTFVNQSLADFYGIPGVVGEEFQKVDLDTTQRLGLLTQGAIQTGTTISNFTNPVRRGVFLLRHIMCIDLPDPPESFADDIKPPDPDVAATGRQRYSQHSQDPACAGCHAVMDPPGFALENFDAVGLWRDEENGVTLDASGNLSVLPEPFDGPVALVKQIAASERTQNCFAEQWLTFGYGRAMEPADMCTLATVEQAFAQSGYDVQQLLLALTQTPAFLHLEPEGRP